MKIVYVTPFYYPVIGGVENVTQTVAEYAVSQQHEVYSLTYNRLRTGGENSLPKEEVLNGVHIIRANSTFSWSHGTYSLELPDIIRKLKPDIVHVHAWRHPHVFQVARLKDELQFKAILHGHAPFHNRNQVGLLTWLYHKVIDSSRNSVLNKFDTLIALTPHERDILVKRLGVNENKITIIPNGISEEIYKRAQQFVKPSAYSNVLYLGRISKSKNIDLLFKAMQILNAKQPYVKLIMAGPDEGLADRYKTYASKHNVNLHYVGTVTEAEKFNLYCNCKVFVHPALYEPFGITLLEVQAFGKPCIVTGAGGQTYVAPVATSLHVAPTASFMSEAISTLIKNADLYEQMSDNARKWAFQHVWSNILPKYDAIYELT